MNDLGSNAWRPRLWLPLVIGLQVGLVWLAAQLWQTPQHRDAPSPLPEGNPVRVERPLPGAADRAQDPASLAVQLPATADASAEPAWLPPLCDPARALVASFESLADDQGPVPSQPHPWEDDDCDAAPLELGPPVAVRHAAPAPASVPAPAASETAPQEGPSLSADVEPPTGPGDGDPTVRPPDPVAEQPAEARPIPAADPTPARRSVQLEMIARQADMHTRRAFELAGRRAYFSARSEFIMALRLIAQGLDGEHRTGEHSAALARGLTAIREAEDFVPGGSRLEADLDLRATVAGHRTPVLKDARFAARDGEQAAAGAEPGPPSWPPVTPLAALKRYLTYAQEQLAAAVGHEVAGAMALHGLGKLHAALAEQAALGVKAAEPKAMVYYQAALLADPRNYMVANDLGVLLARSGYYDDARAMLTHSLSVQAHAVGWRNLAVVCRQLGQYDQAVEAARRWQDMRQAEIARQGGSSPTAGPMVRWVPPETLAQANRDLPAADRAPPPGAGKDSSGQEPEPGPRQAARRPWYFLDPAAPADARPR